jgi:hypothetical protein
MTWTTTTTTLLIININICGTLTKCLVMERWLNSLFFQEKIKQHCKKLSHGLRNQGRGPINGRLMYYYKATY